MVKYIFLGYDEARKDQRYITLKIMNIYIFRHVALDESSAGCFDESYLPIDNFISVANGNYVSHKDAAPKK